MLVIWAFAFVALLVGLQLSSRELVSDPILIVSFFVIGAILGCIEMIRINAVSWSYIARHISKESIEKRIRELET